MRTVETPTSDEPFHLADLPTFEGALSMRGRALGHGERRMAGSASAGRRVRRAPGGGGCLCWMRRGAGAPAGRGGALSGFRHTGTASRARAGAEFGKADGKGREAVHLSAGGAPPRVLAAGHPTHRAPGRFPVPRQVTFARRGAASGACSRRAGRTSSYGMYSGLCPVRRECVPGVAPGRTLPVAAPAPGAGSEHRAGAGAPGRRGTGVRRRGRRRSPSGPGLPSRGA